MKIKDLFELSVTNITHRKLRAWLTLLGIVIGVAALVSIVSLGQGLSSSVNSSLGDFGTDIITLSPGFSRAMGDFGNFRGRNFQTVSEDAPQLTKKDILTLKKNGNIKSIMESVSANLKIEFLSKSSTTNVKALNQQYWDDFFSYKFDSGRKLNVSDNYSAVIGYNIANTLFENITIGRKITIAGKQFNVVGILKEGESDNSILIPIDIIWGITDNEKDTYSQIQAKLIDETKTEETIIQLDASLLISRKVTLKDKDFTITSPLAMQEQIQSVTGTMTLFLAAIAAVSLIVGAVGIANSMFTSVLEKIKEIGILKALGATDGEIMKMFMIESALFGFVGGVIGVIFGIFGSIFLGFLLSGSGTIIPGKMGSAMTPLVTPELMIVAILLSVGIGFFSGVLPARSASKLKPIDALRYE